VGVYVVSVPGYNVEVVTVVSDPWAAIIRGQRGRQLLTNISACSDALPSSAAIAQHVQAVIRSEMKQNVYVTHLANSLLLELKQSRI
jgi:hypothetical protein